MFLSGLHSFLVSVSIAAMLTSIFAFRFRTWHRHGLLAAYFGGFLAVEWIGEMLFVPPGAMGTELAYVCFAITVLFVLAGHFVQHLERAHDVRGQDE